ncbi:43246_t:CDS:1, partial [Gigaspora margarita]
NDNGIGSRSGISTNPHLFINPEDNDNDIGSGSDISTNPYPPVSSGSGKKQ